MPNSEMGPVPNVVTIPVSKFRDQWKLKYFETALLPFLITRVAAVMTDYVHFLSLLITHY